MLEIRSGLSWLCKSSVGRWRGGEENQNRGTITVIFFFPNRVQCIKPIGVLERSAVSGQALRDSG